MNVLKIMMIVSSLFIVNISADAQLGNLLKKATKAVETAKTTKEKIDASKFVKQEDGVSLLQNPMPRYADIQLVGAYGTATSANFGDVQLVFKVNALQPRTSIKLGGNRYDVSAVAFDEDGNQYKFRDDNHKEYNVEEGMYVKVPMKDVIKDVPQSVQVLQSVRMRCSGKEADNADGMLVLKNVPIQWGVEPK